ncbi:MAG: TonB-dependent receptor [Bacteroidota bacterium]
MQLRIYICLLTIGICHSLSAQALTQQLRGKVIDAETRSTLIGVTVQVERLAADIRGTTTDLDGNFLLSDLPLGRGTLKVSYLGYETVSMALEMTSAKEVVLEISMEEAITNLQTVKVSAVRRRGDARNEMAMISARSFSVEETDRYAGSRGEPARMATNFAGVQGSDDSRNDIVIRGNNPNGVIWRIDGITIPNPNHFGVAGTGGGPVTILNDKFLANSDFFTGAFPAEFGNGLAGAFDLRLRDGNNQQHERSFQFGFLGTDLLFEGPISKESGSSYLATFRYSTLGLFDFLGVQIGTDAVPQYYDGAFRLQFPLKNNAKLAIWGLGGDSNIDILPSEDERPDTTNQLFGVEDRDQYFSSYMYTVGLTYTRPYRDKGFHKFGLAYASSGPKSRDDYIYRRVVDDRYVVDSLPPILGFDFRESKVAGYYFLNQKLSAKASLRFGLNAEAWQLNYQDSTRTLDGIEQTLAPWRTRWDTETGFIYLQPYVQTKLKLSQSWQFTAGLTATYASINDNSLSPVEPRLGASFTPKEGISYNLGIGLHSQLQPLYLYYFGDSTVNDQLQLENQGLGLARSWHFVLGHDRMLAPALRLKVETYFQWLSDLGIGQGATSYSLANSGTGFNRLFPPPLINGGNGRNYGVGLSLEKFLAKNYYFLITGSLFDSEYRAGDGVWRNTTYNGNYALNLLATKSFPFKNGSRFDLSAKYTRAGGRRYGPVDHTASARQAEIVFEDAGVNSLQFRDYTRFDLRFAFHLNRPKVTHEFAVDLVNVFDTRNILGLTYAPNNPNQPIREENQLGRLPIFYWKLDF